VRMAADIGQGEIVSCHRCSGAVEAAHEYCGKCGAPVVLPAVSPAKTKGSIDAADNEKLRNGVTTRLLCAAVHLDQKFGDDAIAEYLVEPLRVPPPTPGVDAAAVLRDAVAARMRRRIRDLALLLLLALLVLLDPAFIVVWLLIGIVTRIALPGDQGRRNAVITLGATLLLLLLYLVLPRLLGVVLPGLPSLEGYEGGRYTALIVVSAVLILVADEFLVAHIVRRWFDSSVFVSDARDSTSALERIVRTAGHRFFRRQLAGVRRSMSSPDENADLADVIVYRDGWPFVGAGERAQPSVIALPLRAATKPDGGQATKQAINVVDLHEHVTAAITALRTASSLAPGRRLERLSWREQVVISAGSLLANRHRMSHVLPHLERRPFSHMRVADARALANEPEEWARYYRCYRIEAWDRNLGTSCYFYVGTDQRMLYLEWTHCVLLPLRREFFLINYASDQSAPLRRALFSALYLPASGLARLRSALHTFVPLEQRPGTVTPARYGAAQSLREMAADDSLHSYQHKLDTVRYVKIIDATLFRAVGTYLEARGYSVTEFMDIVKNSVSNVMDLRGTTIIGSSITGSGSAVQAGTTTVVPNEKGLS
jgi:hypothetical protein